MNIIGEELTEILWEDGEGIISSELDQAQIEVEPVMTTDYSVTVKNAFDCEATFTETVQVSNLEDMVIVTERDTIFKGETTTISVMPPGLYSVEWSPSGSLGSMSGIVQEAMPDETTTYTVVITDAETGCSITRQVTIVVKEVICGEPNIFIPNAFSPNGDGFNDVLYVRGSAITSMYFAVYNRWGEQVFETNDQSIGWDGVFEGETVSTDVYGYYLRVTCIAGDTYETQGNVTVLN